MARRRGRRRGGGCTAAPARHPVGLPRLDANSLSCVADFCSLRDCCALRHRISKRTSQQLASADESEVFARTRVLRRVALWWHATTQHFVARNKNWTSSPDLEVYEYQWRVARVDGAPRVRGMRATTTLARHLHMLLRARRVRTLRLGGVPVYYYYILDANRFIANLTHTSYNLQAPWSSFHPSHLIGGCSSAEHDRKTLLEVCGLPTNILESDKSRGQKLADDLENSYARCFSHQQFSEFLALDKAIRRGTQRPRASLTRPWLFLDRSLARDYCPQCNRFRDQRKPSFHPRTTRRGGLPCSFCETMPWHKALRRYRLTPAQLPRGPTWHRYIPAKRQVIIGGPPWRRQHIGAEHISDKRWVRVPMVNKCRAEEAARRVWGEDAQARAARAKTRAKKRKRRRQRARATGPKEKDQVRGLAGSLISSKA